MADELGSGVVPIPLGLPSPRKVESWSDKQWEVLFALLDAVTPSIVIDSEVTDGQNQLRITEAQCLEAYERTKRDVRNAPDYEKFKEYLRSRPVNTPEYVEAMRRFVGHLPRSTQQDLGRLLSLLK